MWMNEEGEIAWMALDSEPWFLPIYHENNYTTETERELWRNWNDAWEVASRLAYGDGKEEIVMSEEELEDEEPEPDWEFVRHIAYGSGMEEIIMREEELEDEEPEPDCYITKVVKGVDEDGVNDPDWIPDDEEYVMDLTNC
jgi:hypothetical protein